MYVRIVSATCDSMSKSSSSSSEHGGAEPSSLGGVYTSLELTSTIVQHLDVNKIFGSQPNFEVFVLVSA